MNIALNGVALAIAQSPAGGGDDSGGFSGLLGGTPWIDIVGLGIIVFFLVRGITTGLVWQVTRLVGVVIAVLVARSLSPEFTPRVQDALSLPLQACQGLVWFTVFAVTLIIAALLGKLAQKALEAVQLGAMDRMGGALAGAPHRRHRPLRPPDSPERRRNRHLDHRHAGGAPARTCWTASHGSSICSSTPRPPSESSVPGATNTTWRGSERASSRWRGSARSHSATPSSSRSKLRRRGGARANARIANARLTSPSGKYGRLMRCRLPSREAAPQTAFLPIAFARGSRCDSCAVPPL